MVSLGTQAQKFEVALVSSLLSVPGTLHHVYRYTK